MRPGRRPLILTEKRCALCAVVKPVSEFYTRPVKDVRGELIRRKPVTRCKACYPIRTIAWKRNNPDKAKRYEWRTNLRMYYGIDIVDWERMFEAQGGRCAICRVATQSAQGRRLAVDHDHASGRVRSLLCGNCNRGLSGFKDNTELLMRAIEYLQRHAVSTVLAAE